MHICTVIKDKVQSLQTERNKYIFERDLDDDSDGAHLTSFGIPNSYPGYESRFSTLVVSGGNFPCIYYPERK